MIYDAKGNEWRAEHPIGFHRHDQIDRDVRTEVKPERGYLPDYVAYESNDEMVMARRKR